MGDGINAAPALHVADVAISVNTAVDAAKVASDLVLLEQNLDIPQDGTDEGRRTLLFVFCPTNEEFRTGWFVESLLTELAIATGIPGT